MIKYRGHQYRAAVEVSFDALDQDQQYLVKMWLDQSGKQPGTDEYQQYQKKLIDKILMLSEQPLDQRVNATRQAGMILYRGARYRRADYTEQLDQVYLAVNYPTAKAGARKSLS